ncbi:4-hydroxy-3-methylbut-2-enyl diphosphate reductase [Acetitomaculum ruminis]
MNIEVAKTAGFCFGVERAIKKVYEQVQNAQNKPIYTYGPIIHNEYVVNELERKGVKVIDDYEELVSLEKGTVVIRSHGVSKEIYDMLKRKENVTIIDATCPFVLKIHDIVEKQSKEGYHIIVIGDKDHPEVEGIRGWCEGNDVTIINSREEAENFLLKSPKKICIVAQTTYNKKKFKEFVEIISKMDYYIKSMCTICSATKERQDEAREIASRADAMIVIGGKHSSNTQKLFEICKKECANTYYIQTLDDLDLSNFESTNNVGITAGASTPKKIIEEVQRNVR